jgi:hypothetical protein
VIATSVFDLVVYAALAWIGLLTLLVFLLALRPAPRRGGMLDHSRAAARGELDLDWSDPRRRLRSVDEA